MAYDYELHDGFLAKFSATGFTDIHTFSVDEGTKRDKRLFSAWNALFARHVPALRIDTRNLVLTSAKKLVSGEPHKPHSAMLLAGIDAFTLKLFVGGKTESTSNDIARLAKVMVYAYRLAEANERAVESTFFTYLIANNTHAVLKDIIVIIGFVVPGVIFLFVR